jgi:hypothetical protein
MTINTTFVIKFQSDSGSEKDSHLSAEVDARDDGLNGGKTNFAPGDNVYFLLYKSSNVKINSVVTTAGTVLPLDAITVVKTEDVSFVESNTTQTEVPVKGTEIVSTEWMGSSLGAITLQADKTTLKTAVSGIGIATIGYNAEALPYRLTAPNTINGKADFSILVVITGTAF